jgi:hypothetical protein
MKERLARRPYCLLQPVNVAAVDPPMQSVADAQTIGDAQTMGVSKTWPMSEGRHGLLHWLDARRLGSLVGFHTDAGKIRLLIWALPARMRNR